MPAGSVSHELTDCSDWLLLTLIDLRQAQACKAEGSLHAVTQTGYHGMHRLAALLHVGVGRGLHGKASGRACNVQS